MTAALTRVNAHPCIFQPSLEQQNNPQMKTKYRPYVKICGRLRRFFIGNICKLYQRAQRAMHLVRVLGDY